jgi:hypothetical protein
MKVFISHKDADSLQALLLKRAFEDEGVSAYLDVLDSSINGGGKTLTEHIKNQLNQCTDIIVLMTEATKHSWWVPFEIGMSAQIDMPTASYLKENVVLPSFLSYWPRLKTINDVSTYVSVRKKTERILNEQYSNFELSSVSNRRKIETPIFYENLKRELR